MNAPPVALDVVRLAQRCDPFKSVVWLDRHRPLMRSEVRRAVAEGRVLAPQDVSRTTHSHVRRVAWFVVHGWSEPIDVDFGVPSLGCHVDWVIQDGNHRFAAALYRGDASIMAACSGAHSEIIAYAQDAREARRIMNAQAYCPIA